MTNETKLFLILELLKKIYPKIEEIEQRIEQIEQQIEQIRNEN